MLGLTLRLAKSTSTLTHTGLSLPLATLVFKETLAQLAQPARWELKDQRVQLVHAEQRVLKV